MEFQVELMQDRGMMRDQKEDLGVLMTRPLERSLEGSSEKPSSRVVSQGSVTEPQGNIRQWTIPPSDSNRKFWSEGGRYDRGHGGGIHR
jgi:hypothetical protein